MQITQDYYKILGIAPNTSMNEIINAYCWFWLAFRYHPDRNQSDSNTNQKMEDIHEAYDTLSDAAKRRKCDISLGYRTISPSSMLAAK
jgi:molecular chaperone DnaJ